MTKTDQSRARNAVVIPTPKSVSVRSVKHPVFPAREEVKVSKAVLSAHQKTLINWPTTIQHFAMYPPTANTVRRLIVVEVQTRNRPTMLNRLLSRLHVLERREMMKLLKI